MAKLAHDFSSDNSRRTAPVVPLFAETAKRQPRRKPRSALGRLRAAVRGNADGMAALDEIERALGNCDGMLTIVTEHLADAYEPLIEMLVDEDVLVKWEHVIQRIARGVLHAKLDAKNAAEVMPRDEDRIPADAEP